MKFYTLYTPSHEFIYEDFFLKSFPQNEFDLISKKFDQLCASANYRENGWKETMLHKMDLIIDGLKENVGKHIVHGDCDIQFFPPKIKETLLNEIGDMDIAFQNDGTRYCAGFFICKSTDKLISLFQDIKDNLAFFPDDQEALQYFLYKKYQDLKVKTLSSKFYTYASDTNWSVFQGFEEITPKQQDILIHHANYTVGIENKIKLLLAVKSFKEKK